MKKILLVAFALFLSNVATGTAQVSTFDDLTLAPGSFWNGSDNTGLFVSADTTFNNYYDGSFDYWEGFAYSNQTDTNQTGIAGQYTAYSNGGAGGGVDGSENFAIGYLGFIGTIPRTVMGVNTGVVARTISGIYLTNNAFTFWSMKEGDAFAKKFGDDPSTPSVVETWYPDWFLLTIYGLDESYERTGQSVKFYLADFRSPVDAADYIVEDWTWLDLTSLGVVYGLEFELSSSDNGDFGMNTPAYFALDNLSYPPLPNIKANGEDGPVAVTNNDSVDVTVSLLEGDKAGVKCDWFVSADTPIGKYWYVEGSGWTQSETPLRAANWGIFNIRETSLYNGRLPEGAHHFSFILDDNYNGVLDHVTWYDQVILNVTRE